MGFFYFLKHFKTYNISRFISTTPSLVNRENLTLRERIAAKKPQYILQKRKLYFINKVFVVCSFLIAVGGTIYIIFESIAIRFRTKTPKISHPELNFAEINEKEAQFLLREALREKEVIESKVLKNK